LRFKYEIEQENGFLTLVFRLDVIKEKLKWSENAKESNNIKYPYQLIYYLFKTFYMSLLSVFKLCTLHEYRFSWAGVRNFGSVTITWG